MHLSHGSPVRRDFLTLLTTSFLLLSGAAAQASGDTYTSGTATLTSPSMTIGSATYSMSISGITLADVVSVAGGTPNGTSDTYTPAGGNGPGTLFIPSVLVNGSKTYTNVTLKVPPPPATSINITQLNGVDVLSGPLTDFTLQSPSVQVGNSIFVDVTLINLTTQDIVTPPQGGMPKYVRDQYFPPNLFIPVVFAANHVFTNVVIAVAKSNITNPVGADVPNVVGESQAAATAAITASLLQVGTLSFQSSSTVPVGDVISQNPAAGTAVDLGTPIGLVISSPESLVYSFGTNGGYSVEPYYLFQAIDGNLYGTTIGGGTDNNGTIFKVAPGSGGSTVYTFPSPDSAGLYGPNGLVFDNSDGNLWGVTSGGGTYGGGTLYKLTTSGSETAVYNFCGCIDNYGYYEGVDPSGALAIGSDGAFYGTTQGGNGGGGTFFRIPTNGLGGVLYTFGSSGATDGVNPIGNLVWDGALGKYFGATSNGGANGTGAVFQVSPAGVESVLYSFGVSGSTDPQQPVGGLALAPNGNLYGMTRSGGANNTGTVYEVTPAGVPTVLYSFVAQVGSYPPTPTGGTLAVDSAGNLYGVTEYGGTQNVGTVFKLTPAGNYSTVYSFAGGTTDAALPAWVILASDGNLYGTAFLGGTNGTGAVFRIRL